MDLGFRGPKYTWKNRQQGQNNIRVRMDRVVANGQFSKLFGDVDFENIITTSSDHFVVHLSISKHEGKGTGQTIGHNFRYEAAWCRALGYLETVERSWTQGLAGTKDIHTTWANLMKMATTLSD